MPHPPSTAAPGADAPTVELAARVRLAHASLARRAEAAGIRALHVKGYAMSDGVYRTGRTSSDVDLLVDPERAPRLLQDLADHGWSPVADFAEGSIFEHAATLWHTQLAYVDVHRLFPGLGPDPRAAFEALWAERQQRVIAGHPVPVPSLRHQRLVVVVHAARDGSRGRGDVDHLRRSLSAEEWGEVREAAQELGAATAWSVATGETVLGEDAQDRHLFEALQRHESGMDLLATRWRAARSPAERARILLHTVPVNRPHLQMRLGRVPTRADILREQGERARQLMRWLWEKGVRRGR